MSRRCVTIDLALLAKRLSQGGKRFDEMDASRWLSRAAVKQDKKGNEIVDSSPFVRTEYCNMFLCDETAVGLFEDGELIHSYELKPASK